MILRLLALHITLGFLWIAGFLLIPAPLHILYTFGGGIAVVFGPLLVIR